jgi:N-acetylneuraminate synthase
MLGAEAIEVHITLDRSSYGSDQSSSLEERGLELAIRDCVSIDKYLGRGLKDFSDKEKAVAKKLRYWL